MIINGPAAPVTPIVTPATHSRLSTQQADLFLARFRAMTPSQHTLDLVNRLGLADRLAAVMAESKAHARK